VLCFLVLPDRRRTKSDSVNPEQLNLRGVHGQRNTLRFSCPLLRAIRKADFHETSRPDDVVQACPVVANRLRGASANDNAGGSFTVAKDRADFFSR